MLKALVRYHGNSYGRTQRVKMELGFPSFFFTGKEDPGSLGLGIGNEKRKKKGIGLGFGPKSG